MRNVIKLTESQLKKMVKDAINEQATTKYFDAFKKWADTHGLEGVGVSGDKRMRQYNFSKGMPVFEIMDDGSVVKIYSNGEKVNGKMSILSDGQIQISLDNGDTWTSTPKITSTPNKTSQINTANCANQLIDIANDPSKRKILKFGCKTQAVKELQTLLDVVGKDGVPTGYFGSKTKQAVIDFQKKNKLKKIEGIVGPETYKALTPNAVPAPAKDLKEDFDDEEDSYNYLQSLFNTEDDYDGEPFRNDDDGFSDKMKRNLIMKKIKLGDTETSGAYYSNKDKKKQREFEKRKYAGLDPLRNDTQPAPYSPIKSDDLSLDKYLEKKKMGNLDEDDSEDNYNYLNSLFTKD